MPHDELFQSNMIEGMNRFQNARMRAFWQDMMGLLRGQPAELLSFEDIRTRLRLHEESYRGLQDVPLDRIIGSVGRYKDFSRNFLPRSGEMQERWSRVYAQANSMEGLPPIELYKVDDVYFVRDGNHRVSVARQLGNKTIEAHVTELPTVIDLEPNMTRDELHAATLYAAFLDETKLTRTRPHHQSMQLSDPNRFSDLRRHISLHAIVLEKTRTEPLTVEEAAADWYDNVYRPAVTLIRKYKVTMEELTEADVYVVLVEHLTQLRAEQGEEAATRTFSDAIANLMAEKKQAVPRELHEEKDKSVTLTRSQIKALLERKRAEMEDEAPE
jgi:hypothetical protein